MIKTFRGSFEMLRFGALAVALFWGGCAKTVGDTKIESASGAGVSERDAADEGPAEPQEAALGEGWKNVEVRRVSFSMPEGWTLSSNPMAPSYSNQLKVYSPDDSCTVMMTLTRWRDDMTLTEAVQLTHRGMAVRMGGVPDFHGATVEGGGGEEDALWGRKGVLTHFEVVRASEVEGGEKVVLLRAEIFGQLIEASGEVLFITILIKGEDKGESEKIIRSLRILPKPEGE